MTHNCVNYKGDYFDFIKSAAEYYRRYRKEDSYNQGQAI